MTGLISKNQIAVALVLIAVVCWSGNWVVGRSVRDIVPPFGLTFWRWTLAAALLTPFALPKMLREWPTVRANWKVLLGMGLLSGAMFQAMIYIGVHTTTALNASLLSASGPAFTLFIAVIVLRERVTLRQLSGIAIAFIGAGWLVLRGDLAALASLDFTVGDIWIVAAMFVWGAYSVLLRFRPSPLSDLTLVYVISIIAVVMLFPVWLWEMSQGHIIEPNVPTWLTLVYVAVFASIVALLSFNASVAMIGPTKAVTYLYFMPVFGAAMAIVFLGEDLAGYHLIGFVVVMAGVLLATLEPGSRRQAP